MSTAFTSGSWQSSCQWVWTDTLTISNTSNNGSTGKTRKYTTGTGAGQANKIFVNQYTILASGNQQLDLYGGVVDYAYQTINFTTIKEIYIALETITTASTILVGGGTDGAGTNAFVNWVNDKTDMVRCGNGCNIAASRNDATGFAVTNGTGDILRILNEDGTNLATVTVVLLGCG